MDLDSGLKRWGQPADAHPMTSLDDSSTSTASKAKTSGLTAGWYDDPQGLHRQRFYDGKSWTAHVTHFGPKPCKNCAN